MVSGISATHSSSSGRFVTGGKQSAKVDISNLSYKQGYGDEAKGEDRFGYVKEATEVVRLGKQIGMFFDSADEDMVQHIMDLESKDGKGPNKGRAHIYQLEGGAPRE